jgi:cyclohexanone monooxygenase
MPPTVWNSGGCASWYIDKNGRNTTIWPDFTWKFRRLTKDFDIAAYDSVGSPDGSATGPGVDAALAGSATG